MLEIILLTCQKPIDDRVPALWQVCVILATDVKVRTQSAAARVYHAARRHGVGTPETCQECIHLFLHHIDQMHCGQTWRPLLSPHHVQPCAVAFIWMTLNEINLLGTS
jgi:hypothetical protein